MKNDLIFAAALTVGAIVLCLLFTPASGPAAGAGFQDSLADLVRTAPPSFPQDSSLQPLPHCDEVVWVQVQPGPGLVVDGETEVMYCPFVPASSNGSPPANVGGVR